jgi:hypothetical protein
MTPALLENAGVGAGRTEGAAPADADRSEQLQRAFEQGVEYAQQQMQQQQAESDSAVREQQLGSQQQDNDERSRALASRIDELQQREYRAPMKPMACKEERSAMLACYKTTQGAPPGEVVCACQAAAEELEKCAALARQAALAKVVPGSVS